MANSEGIKKKPGRKPSKKAEPAPAVQPKKKLGRPSKSAKVAQVVEVEEIKSEVRIPRPYKIKDMEPHHDSARGLNDKQLSALRIRNLNLFINLVCNNNISMLATLFRVSRSSTSLLVWGHSTFSESYYNKYSCCLGLPYYYFDLLNEQLAEKTILNYRKIIYKMAAINLVTKSLNEERGRGRLPYTENGQSIAAAVYSYLSAIGENTIGYGYIEDSLRYRIKGLSAEEAEQELNPLYTELAKFVKVALGIPDYENDFFIIDFYTKLRFSYKSLQENPVEEAQIKLKKSERLAVKKQKEAELNDMINSALTSKLEEVDANGFVEKAAKDPLAKKVTKAASKSAPKNPIRTIPARLTSPLDPYSNGYNMYAIPPAQMSAGYGMFDHKLVYVTNDHSEYPMRGIMLEQLDVEASAGPGTYTEGYQSTQQVFISEDEYYRFLSCEDPDTLKVIKIAGDSMEPLLRNGQTCVIKLTSIYNNPGVYVFTYGQVTYIKRLSRIPGPGGKPRYTVASENKHYPPFDIEEGENFIIHGRLVLGLNYTTFN